MLIGNGALVFRQPLRLMGGGAAGDIAGWVRAERMNRMVGAFPQISGGTPNGTLHPIAWVLPLKPGAMAGRYTAALSMDASGAGVGGVNGQASATLTIDAAASGALVAFGTGTGSLAMTATGGMAGLLQAAGTGTLSVAASGGLSAPASIEGSGTFSVTATATRLPADDTPPARTASATFSFSGSLLPYAIGHMAGDTNVAGELTQGAIAAAVVDALEATTIPVDVQRVRGQALEGTGVDGDPWGPA